MFGSDCGGCFSVPTYERALAHWERTPLPRGKYWEPHQRPLDDRRKPHYRLEIGNDGEYYDVFLYNTVMARYHKPTADGWRVQYNYHNSNTSHNFMGRVLGLRTRVHGVLSLRTTDGRTVMVPIGTGSHFNAAFGASLWFVGDDVIDVSRSDHEVVTIPKYSPEFRAWRYAMREGLRPLTDLLEFCTEEVRQSWEPPAQSRVYAHPGALWVLGETNTELKWLREWCSGRSHYTPTDLLTCEPFIDRARGAYKEYVKRSLDVRDFRELPTPTTEVLAKAATRMLLKQLEVLWGTRASTVRKQLPKFVEHLPGNFRR